MTFGTLHSLSLLRISGADSATFLQGQLTNDVNLSDKQWQFSGYCNPKGRLLASLQLWKTGSNEFFALLSEDLTESIVKRLRMYVMRSNVEITVLNRTISGYSSFADIATQHPELDGKINRDIKRGVCLLNNDRTVLNISDRYLLIHDQTATTEPFDSQWQEQNIMDGLPQITSESAELFIPQMVNLDLLDGINFKKGCYTGQEIVARMHYLGKVKQRMFVCQVGSETGSIGPGDKIYNNLDERKPLGNIVTAVQNKDKILAVLKLDNIDSDLYLEGGQKINPLKSQPYSLPV